VLDDAGHEAGTGLGAGDEFTLPPNAVPVGQQAADDSPALAVKDIARFQFKTEIAARQGMPVHEQSLGTEVSAAIQIEGVQLVLAAEVEHAWRKLRCDQDGTRIAFARGAHERFQFWQARLQAVDWSEPVGPAIEGQGQTGARRQRRSRSLATSCWNSRANSSSRRMMVCLLNDTFLTAQ
jgi:hypothetical protein